MTCVNRFNRWRRVGHWARILEAASEAYDGDIQMIYSSSIRVHQGTANGQKTRRSDCMGRSRGGLTTKIHALVDAEGRPIRMKLTAGQAHDGRSAADMFDSVQAGDILLGDCAYDSDGLRAMLKARGARGPASVRCRRAPPSCLSARGSIAKATQSSAFTYSLEPVAFTGSLNKLKHFRAVATRCNKRDDKFLAFVQLASIRIWLRIYESVI